MKENQAFHDPLINALRKINELLHSTALVLNSIPGGPQLYTV